MIIEGTMLLGVLIITALAIAALLVYIRFAVRKEEPEADSLFSRLMRFGSNDAEEEEEDDGQENTAQPQTPQADGGLSMPGMSLPGRAGEKTTAKPEKRAGLSIGSLGRMSAPFSGLTGLSGLFGGRKSKEKIKEEVQAIDEQLNSVLQETTEISVLGLPPEIGGIDTPISDGRGMRELDLEMGTLNDPGLMTPNDFPLVMPALETPAPAAVPAPMAMPEETPKSPEQRKPDEPQAPPAAEPAKNAMDNFMTETKGSGDDLLDDLEASARQEELIDTSIMKEYQDMPITCVELESELKGILDQITINMHGKGREQA